jgi:putative effector of murein hydrolase
MNSLYAQPLFGFSITVLAYVLATLLNRRWAVFNVLLGTCGGLALLLLVARIPYEQYNVGGSYVTFFLGPATVALAVPFYRHAQQIGRQVPRLLIAIGAGTVTSSACAVGVAWLAGAPKLILLTMVARGVTTPIAMDITLQLGGDPKLIAIITGVSGLVGALIGPAVLQFAGVRHDLAAGVAMGTSAHGIGTARALRQSAVQGGASALALTVAGILTAFMAIPLRWFLTP